MNSINIVDQTPEAEDLINQAEPEVPAEPAAPEYHEEPAEPEYHEEPTEPVSSSDVNPERAFEESNQDFFDVMREKLSNLRRERNECIVQIDKKEDAISIEERRNSQYEVVGTPEKISRDRIEQLESEIRDLRDQIASKDRIIHGVLKTLRTL